MYLKSIFYIPFDVIHDNSKLERFNFKILQKIARFVYFGVCKLDADILQTSFIANLIYYCSGVFREEGGSEKIQAEKGQDYIKKKRCNFSA